MRQGIESILFPKQQRRTLPSLLYKSFFYVYSDLTLLSHAKISESPHKTNSVCHDWRRYNDVYEFMSGYCGPDIGNHYKHQTYTVASGTSVTGSVFMQRSRLFLGQCTLYLRFFSKVFPTFLDLFFSKTDPWTNLRINRLYMYNTSKKTSSQVCATYFFSCCLKCSWNPLSTILYDVSL